MVYVPLVSDNEIDWLFFLCEVFARDKQSKLYHIETGRYRSFRQLNMRGKVGGLKNRKRY